MTEAEAISPQTPFQGERRRKRRYLLTILARGSGPARRGSQLWTQLMPEDGLPQRGVQDRRHFCGWHCHVTSKLWKEKACESPVSSPRHRESVGCPGEGFNHAGVPRTCRGSTPCPGTEPCCVMNTRPGRTPTTRAPRSAAFCGTASVTGTSEIPVSAGDEVS